MKKLLIFVSNFLIVSSINFTFSRSYPFKQVAKPWCKFEIWQNLSEDCKIKLPIIKNADYRKYKDDLTYRLIYSVLWTATYKNWWDIWYGSHLGVDIATSLWTPVYSIWNWIVEKAEYLNWWGNTVVIKHNLWNWKYIRSVYAHLNKITVKKWQYIKEGEKIWEVWHSGYAWWNHLHFQIDINQSWFHPYYYNWCWNPSVVVNKWLCQNKVISNTVDPIYFLESNWANIIKTTQPEKIKEIPQQIVQKEKINPNEIISREKLRLTELQLFLARYKINFKSLIPWNVLYKWKNWIIKIYVKNKRGKPFTWIFPENIKITTSVPWIVKILPIWIKYISNWQRSIKITALKSWTTDIIVQINWKQLYRKTIRVIDKNTIIKPYSAYWILTSKKPHIWDEIWWIILLRDKSFHNIIKVPYEWKFLVKAENAKICPVFVNLKNIKKLKYIKCSTSKAVSNFWFDYQNSLEWITLFKVLPNNPWKSIKISIYTQNWKLFWTIQSFYPIKRPRDFKNTSIWNLKYKL